MCVSLIFCSLQLVAVLKRAERVLVNVSHSQRAIVNINFIGSM